MERLSVEEAALIKKMATERLKDQLIKAGYSADEVNTWDRDRLLAAVAEEKVKGLGTAPKGAEAMTLEERKLIAQEEELALRKQERIDRLKAEEARLKREDAEKAVERAEREKDREFEREKVRLKMELLDVMRQR